jgi:hypothetical protein
MQGDGLIPNFSSDIDGAVEMLRPLRAHQLEFEGSPHDHDRSYIGVGESIIPTQANVRIPDQLPLCLVPEASAQSVGGRGGKGFAQPHRSRGEGVELRDCRVGNNARPHSPVLELPAVTRPQQNHASDQGLNLAVAAGEVSASCPDGFPVDPLLLLLDCGQCVLGYHSTLYPESKN